MTKPLTPQQAADRAKCGRSSIMRALVSGELRANRDNNGRWHIDPAALDDWMTMRPSDRQQPAITKAVLEDTSQHLTVSVLDTIRVERDEARLEAASLRTEATQLRDRLDDARSERDRWRQMAERLSEASLLPLSKPQGGFLARLLGRN